MLAACFLLAQGYASSVFVHHKELTAAHAHTTFFFFFFSPRLCVLCLLLPGCAVLMPDAPGKFTALWLCADRGGSQTTRVAASVMSSVPCAAAASSCQEVLLLAAVKHDQSGTHTHTHTSSSRHAGRHISHEMSLYRQQHTLLLACTTQAD
jgi:hypothetical protein